jgi:hypothetical protein
MFGDGLQGAAFELVGTRLVFHFCMQRGEEPVCELGEVAIGALCGALPENKVRRESEHNEN